MKTKQKTLLLLLGLVVVLAVAFALLTAHNTKREQAEARAAQDAVIHVAAIPEPEEIRYNYLGADIRLTNTEDGWLLADDPDFTVSENLTTNMAGKFADFTANRQIERDAATNYGFDTPAMTVTVTANGQDTTLVWGAKNTVTGDYYLEKQGDEAVYTVEASTIQAFEYTVAELYSGITMLDVSAEDVSAFALSLPDGSSIAFEKAEQETDENVIAPAGQADTETTAIWKLAGDSAADVDQTAAEQALAAVCGQTTQWTFTNVTDPAQYGFGEETLTVELTLADGSKKTLLVGGTSAYDGNRCVMLPGTDRVYTLTAAAMTPLDTDFSEYIVQ